MKILLIAFSIGVLLRGCGPAPAPSATSTATFVVSIPTASPVDNQLPFNPEVSNYEYCQPPYAVLSISDSNDISEDEIVYKLVKMWLRRYKQANAPLFCRIEDYTIDKVYDDPSVYSQALEPRGDFMRVIAFSVKLIQTPNYWMSFAGELDSDNWLHSGHIVAVSRTGDGYKMEFANP